MTTPLTPVPVSPVAEIVAEMRAGRMVILVDEEDRENEGDLVLAADHVTPEAINFMARFGRGLICLTLTRERCEFLKLPPMAARNGTVYSTAFTVSIEAAEGVTTGISAADRARTVQVAVAKTSQPTDLVQPGHIFPLQAVDGGVLMRAGHTEAGCDLAAMAGCSPAAVICEIMKDDGTMARLPDLQLFAAEHGLKIGTIADLIEYRSRTESLVQKVGSRVLHTAFGDFTAHAFQDEPSQAVHLALVRGQWQPHVKVVNAPLLKNVLQSGERIVRVNPEGKPSETRFKVEERYEFATLMRCSPVTGRTHQIRVHTQYAGHPIAFDDRYGDREFDRQLTEAGTGLNRLFLHAAALKFTHPGTGEVMRIEAPMDEGLKRCLQKLRNAR